MNEGVCQDFLLRALTVGKKGDAAFVRRTNADFCREYAMDKGLLIEFLEAIQPETMAALSNHRPVPTARGRVGVPPPTANQTGNVIQYAVR